MSEEHQLAVTASPEAQAFELVQRQAKMFASSTLVPKEFQGNLSNCAIALNMAERLGADPFMVMQSLDVIHGRPSFRATFLIAMINQSGRFEPLQFKATENGGGGCICWTRTKRGGEVVEGPEVTLDMAKAEGWSTKAGSKWKTLPDLMLRYRAAAFFARLHAPDITLGMRTTDENRDIIDVEVSPAEDNGFARPRFLSAPAGDHGAQGEPATGSVSPIETDPRPGADPDEAEELDLEEVDA